MKTKSIKKQRKEDLGIFLTIIRSDVIASHLIIMEEIRTLQGLPFDYGEETKRFTAQRTRLAETLSAKNTKEALSRVLARRQAVR